MKTNLPSLRQRASLRLALMTCAVVLVGCATGPQVDPRDPLEPYNRAMFQFNDSLDRAVVKPVATAYKDNLPYLVRKGVSNFFDNLQDAWSFVNSALQLKGEAAGDNFFRFGVNTLIGLGGVLDVASEMGIERHTEDFGQTLGYWGVGPGPYIVLPLLGPSTLRDTVALPVDAKGNVVSDVQDVPTRNSLTVLKVVDRRAGLLQATSILDQVALDPYLFARDAYLQHRRSAVYDGNPPDEPVAPATEAPAK
jgi:phospholipid-binding lipoprotein MlaA